MEYYVTREGLKKLYNEIGMQDAIHDELEKEMGKSVKRDNDLRENPEYMQLRVKAMYGIPQEKRNLVLKYNNAVIIEETPEYINWNGETVIRKCDIKIDYNGEIEEYSILGSNEGNLLEGILSCESPLVKALLGKKVGETILFNNEPVTVLLVEKSKYDVHSEKELQKVKKIEEHN